MEFKTALPSAATHSKKPFLRIKCDPGNLLGENVSLVTVTVTMFQSYAAVNLLQFLLNLFGLLVVRFLGEAHIMRHPQGAALMARQVSKSRAVALDAGINRRRVIFAQADANRARQQH